MQTNWSLVINIVLLAGVIFAIMRLMKARRQSFSFEAPQPSLGPMDSFSDEIISVRKIDSETLSEDFISSRMKQDKPQAPKPQPRPAAKAPPLSASTVMIFLLAKDNRKFAGYDLLQTLLACGLRFGDDHLFHRHQYTDGQGPVLCSLAAATETGIFDMQTIGAFNAKGLCLYMDASNNPSIDVERFFIMIDTAKQLSEGLDCHLLDDRRQPLTEERISAIHQLLNVGQLARA